MMSIFGRSRRTCGVCRAHGARAFGVRAASVLAAAAVVFGPGTEAQAAFLPTQENEECAYSLSIDPEAAEAAYSLGTPVLYSYGPPSAGNTEETGGREAEIALVPRSTDGTGDRYRVTAISATPVTTNVAVSVDRRDGTAYGGKRPPVLTVRASAEGLEPEDYEVRLSIAVGEWTPLGASNPREIVVTVRGTAALSACREVSGGGTYQVEESEGCVFRLGGALKTPATVDCGEDVRVIFSGEYEEELVNLLVSTQLEAPRRNLPEDVQVVDFTGSPELSAPVQVVLGGREGLSHLYQLDKTDGTLTPLQAQAEDDGTLTFPAASLGCYLLTAESL